MSAAWRDDETELLAAELAFGLLDDDERRDADARLAYDPSFRSLHDKWRSYAVAMFNEAVELPSPSLWSRIESRLPSNDRERVTPVPSLVRWWQLSTLIASVAALILGVVVAGRPSLLLSAPRNFPARPSPAFVAVLTGKAQSVVTVIYDPTTHRIILAPARFEVDRHSAQLWVIPVGRHPRSLGLIKSTIPSSVQAFEPSAEDIAAGSTFAISIEPIGGSETGQPTGPVVLSGTVEEV